MRIQVSADSACDLTKELLERYRIHIFPLTVTMGEKTGLDGVDVSPDEIVRFVDAGGALPSTAAVNPETYAERFAAWSGEFDAVIHVALGSEISSCFRNARIAAEEHANVFVVDSRNLSAGYGLVVLEAARLADSGMEPEKIAAELERIVPKVSTSFVLGRLDYMKKGGRCSTVEALGANLLKLKPMISVQNGKMGVVKKYRGSMEKVLTEYVEEQLSGRTDLVRRRVFITCSPTDAGVRAAVRRKVEELALFDEIVESFAGCTITSHCGPGCLGVLFITE